MGTRKRKPASRARRGAARPHAPAPRSLPETALLRQAPPAPRWLRLLLPGLVAVCAFVTFLPALDAQFVNWDDDKVIVENIHLRGLTSENIKWMFTKTKMGHYQPLTWLSYAVDHAIGKSRYESLPAEAKARYAKGLDPKLFHLTNLLLHAAVAVGFYYLASLLLRLVLPAPDDRPDRAALWAAALAALLFACHPLRVENAVWVTERRDVLSAVFLLPCLLCYVRYALSPRWGTAKVSLYLGAVALLALSLLSKAWGITLPAVMLVLDVYPLKRLGGRVGWFTPRALVAYLDKLPFAALAVRFAIWAKNAQGVQLDTLKSLGEWGYGDRIAQAFYGLFFYSYKTLFPVNLTALVPLPVNNNPLAARYLMAAAAVVAVAVTIFLLRKRWPAGVVLAICYAGVLSPVLGFAQSGPQLVADKYAYLACLTWALLGGGGLLWLLRRRATAPWTRPAVPAGAAAAFVICGVFAVLAWRQTMVWHDSRTLWAHAVAVDPQCVMARTNLGLLERQAGNVDRAIEHYRAAIEIDPEDAVLLNNLAYAIRQDPARLEESIAVSRQAVALQPKHADLHFTLASSLEDAGRLDQALAELNTCVRLKRNQPKYHRSLGRIFLKKKEYEAARKQYQRVLALERKLDPRGMRVADALERLATVYLKTGQYDRAEEHGKRALALALESDPAGPVLINSLDRLGWIMIAQSRVDEARSYFERILAISPRNNGARIGLARARQAGG